MYATLGYRSPMGGIGCARTSFGVWNLTSPHFMVTRCPDTAPEWLKEKCQTNDTSHWNLTQPVTDSSRMTYKNIYCALCHQNRYLKSTAMSVQHNITTAATTSDVGRHNLTAWEARVVLADFDIISGVTTSAGIYAAVMADEVNMVKYIPPTAFKAEFRECELGPMVRRCNETGLWKRFDPGVVRACLQHTAVVIFDKVNYKNSFCLFCNGDGTWDENTTSGVKDSIKHPLPLLILLDFNDNVKNDKGDDDDGDYGEGLKSHLVNDRQCREENHFFDFSTMSCRPVLCSPGKMAKKRDGVFTCQSYPRYNNIYGYLICLVYKSNSTNFRFQSVGKFTYVTGNASVYRTYGAKGQYSTTTLFVMSTVLITPEHRDTFEETTLNNIADFLNNFPDAFKDGELQLAPTCWNELFWKLLPVKAPLPSLIMGVNKDVLTFQNVLDYLPLSNTLTCPMVELGWDEIDYDSSTHEIAIRKGDNSSCDTACNRIGVPNFFVTISNTVLVCLSEYQKATPSTSMGTEEEKEVSKYSSPLYWVSLISTVISLVFLFASFIIYCLLSSIRNVAGINNCILIIALFCGQLFLQIGSEVPLDNWMCPVVGVATHFSWLAVMFAQNACSIHMFFTLSFPLASYAAMADHALVTRKYALYVILASATFVLVTLAWQLGLEGRSGYGGPSCYLAESLVRILMFAGPLLGTVIANIVMFVFTMLRMCSLHHEDNTRSRRISLVVYTKLSVFTGLTWLFGFLASLSDSQVLAYLFAISHGCQGLFVFLAFLANRRVMSQLRCR